MHERRRRGGCRGRRGRGGGHCAGTDDGSTVEASLRRQRLISGRLGAQDPPEHSPLTGKIVENCTPDLSSAKDKREGAQGGAGGKRFPSVDPSVAPAPNRNSARARWRIPPRLYGSADVRWCEMEDRRGRGRGAESTGGRGWGYQESQYAVLWAGALSEVTPSPAVDRLEASAPPPSPSVPLQRAARCSSLGADPARQVPPRVALVAPPPAAVHAPVHSALRLHASVPFRLTYGAVLRIRRLSQRAGLPTYARIRKGRRAGLPVARPCIELVRAPVAVASCLMRRGRPFRGRAVEWVVRNSAPLARSPPRRRPERSCSQAPRAAVAPASTQRPCKP